MKAIILAAGAGKRLGKFGRKTPKCLIKFGDKSIIERQIDALKSNGIEDISVVVGYHADKVKKKLLNKDIKFYLNKVYENTGLLESLFKAKNELDDEIILVYGDVAFKPEVIKSLLKCKKNFCLIVEKGKNFDKNKQLIEKYKGIKIIKGDTKVYISKGLVKKISKNLPYNEISGKYIGVVKFSKKSTKIIYQRIKKLIKSDEVKKYPSPSYLLMSFIEKGFKIYPIYTSNENYAEIDTMEDLKTAKKKFN